MAEIALGAMGIGKLVKGKKKKKREREAAEAAELLEQREAESELAKQEARRKVGLGRPGGIGTGPLGIGGEPNIGKRTLLGGG
jgi:predicted ATP-dependent serine protease